MRPVYINWGICCPPLPCSGIDSDIASSDTYPIPSQSPANIGVWAAADAATGKLSWMWLQASGYAYSVPRDPTGPEEDCMVYSSLINGVRGIVYWMNTPYSPELWGEVEQLGSQIPTLTPILYSLSTPPSVSSSTAGIELIGKTYNSQPYIVSVNDSPSSVNATLSVPSGYVSANVLFENRYVSVSSNTITDTFSGFQSHVYCLLTQAQSAPSITTQPASATVCSGNAATFTVVATGPGLSYQWYNSGGPISGATSASYTTGVAGSYYCVVSGTYSPAATSNTVTLTVNTPPVIGAQPAAQAVCSGNTAAFTVAATGSGLTYQWYGSSGAISGATSASYTTGAAGSYYCVVSGTCSPAATSNTAALTVNTAPAITTQPADQNVNLGTAASFSVVAAGSGTLSYQWQDNGTQIGGATTASFSIPSASICEVGSYQCVVTNNCGSVTSDSAALNISATAVTTVAAARALSDGSVASLSGPAVTRSFSDFFYIEDADRCNAIRVNPCSGSSAAQGAAPTVIGTLQTEGGERVIDPAMIIGAVAVVSPGPLGMLNSSVSSVLDGILVKLWGVATVSGGATNTFTISDGSLSPVTVEIFGAALPSNGSFVMLTGVIGLDGTLVLMVNGTAGDIVSLP